jgi:hypothetical protein
VSEHASLCTDLDDLEKGTYFCKHSSPVFLSVFCTLLLGQMHRLVQTCIRAAPRSLGCTVHISQHFESCTVFKINQVANSRSLEMHLSVFCLPSLGHSSTASRIHHHYTFTMYKIHTKLLIHSTHLLNSLWSLLCPSTSRSIAHLLPVFFIISRSFTYHLSDNLIWTPHTHTVHIFSNSMCTPLCSSPDIQTHWKFLGLSHHIARSFKSISRSFTYHLSDNSPSHPQHSHSTHMFYVYSTMSKPQSQTLAIPRSFPPYCSVFLIHLSVFSIPSLG